MIVGVTGSRHERPEETCQRLRNLLTEWGATELHHGDCMGWDEQAHYIAESLGVKTIAHPPTESRFRAHCPANEVMTPLPYLERNKQIVMASDRIIAAPDGPERLRSGTWATIRAAKKAGKPGLILPTP